MSVHYNLLQSTVPEDPKKPDIQAVPIPPVITNHVPVIEEQQAPNNVDTDELQRCMETDLALFASSAGIGGLISNYHFRQLISSLCSGLRLPPIDIEIDSCLTTNYHEITDILKHVLRDIPKFTVMVNLVHAEKTDVHFLCVSVAFEFQKRLEVVLLAIWEYNFDQSLRFFDIQSVITDTLELYGLKANQIAHTLVGGFEERGIDPSRILVTNYVVSNYQSQMMSILDSILDKSNVYKYFRSQFCYMVQSFCKNEYACDAFYKETGYYLHDAQFEKQLWILLTNRDKFFNACAQNVAHGKIFTLSSDEWYVLEDFFYLRRTIFDYASTIKNSNYLTIDYIVPYINEICSMLNGKFKLLDMLPLRIVKMIQEKFDHLLDPARYSPEAIFISASALNPGLYLSLNDVQRQKAVFEIEEMLYQRTYTTNFAVAKYPSVEDHVYCNKPNKLEKKCNDYIEIFMNSAISQKCLDDKFYETKKAIKRLVSSYCDDVQINPNNPLFANPLNFWHTNAEKYAELAALALDLLTIPASATMPQELMPLDEDSKNVVGNVFSTNDPFDFIRVSTNIEKLERDAIVCLNRNFYYAAKNFMPLGNGVKKGVSMATAGEIQMVYESEHFQPPISTDDDHMDIEEQPAAMLPFLPPPTILNSLPLASAQQNIPPIPPPGMFPPLFTQVPFMYPKSFTSAMSSTLPKSFFFGLSSPSKVRRPPLDGNLLNIDHPKPNGLFKGPLLVVYGVNTTNFNCDRLYNLFSLYGRVMRVKFAIVNQVETSYVEMETLEQAQQAYTFLNQSFVFGNRFLIHPSHTHDRITPGSMLFEMSKGGKSFIDYSSCPPVQLLEKQFVPPSPKVTFFNIPSSCTKEQLIRYFVEREPFGPVPVDFVHSGQPHLHSGYMTFPNVSIALAAVAIYNNLNLGNLKPTVKLCFMAEDQNAAV